MWASHGSPGAPGDTCPHKQELSQTTHIHTKTVNIFEIEHMYRYATLLLGVLVCLGGMCTDS